MTVANLLRRIWRRKPPVQIYKVPRGTAYSGRVGNYEFRAIVDQPGHFTIEFVGNEPSGISGLFIKTIMARRAKQYFYELAGAQQK